MGRLGTGPANSVLQAPELRVKRKRACPYGRGKKSPSRAPDLSPRRAVGTSAVPDRDGVARLLGR